LVFACGKIRTGQEGRGGAPFLGDNSPIAENKMPKPATTNPARKLPSSKAAATAAARVTRTAAKPVALPRYQEIVNLLLAEISAGRYPVGSLLPSEMQLCERFKVSRFTVRAALAALTDKGLVTRRPGAGSVVVATEQRAVFTQTLGDLSELLNFPSDTYRENMDARDVVADEHLASLLGCEPGKAWFCLSALRRSDYVEEPLAWTDVYVLPKYASVVKAKTLERVPLYEQIEKRYGETVERAHFEFFASRIPAKIAKLLRVTPDTPAMTVVRRYTGRSGEIFETTITIHPERRFTYSMELKRELKSWSD
jgi:DNA-binding GntR family transcriptional regulator